MVIKTLVVVSFLLLVTATSSESRQDLPPGPGGYHNQSPYSASPGYAPPAQRSYQYPRPGARPDGGAFRQGYGNQAEHGIGRGYSGNAQNQVPGGAGPQARPYGSEPTYPYPRHHNPYYTGQSIKDVFGGAIDWIVNVPGYLANGVTQFLDNRVFPQVPATHGGPSIPETAPPKPTADRNVSGEPLPQAETYEPKGR